MAVESFATQARGSKTGRAVLAEEANRVNAARLVRVYESHEFDLVSPSTDFSLRSGLNHAVDCSCGRGAFDLIERAQTCYIRNRGATAVTLRFNDTDEDAISIEDGESLQMNFLEVEDILMTNNTGSAIRLKIVMG